LARIPPARLTEILAGTSDAGGTLGVANATTEDLTPWRPARPLRAQLSDAALPAKVSATIAQRLYVERRGLPPALLDALRRLAAFANPEFAERQAMRLSTGLTPRVIACSEDLGRHLALPRGCLSDVTSLLNDLGVKLRLADERSMGSAVDATFTGKLSADQALAVAEMSAHDLGVLCAPPGAGKTVMAINLIASRGRSTPILVHRKPLAEQWLARLREFLDVDADAIGTIGGKRSKPSGVIDIGTVQGLTRAASTPPPLEQYGHVVLDECHHVSAVSIERLLGSCPARYVNRADRDAIPP
jgi:hypothetical protein